MTYVCTTHSGSASRSRCSANAALVFITPRATWRIISISRMCTLAIGWRSSDCFWCFDLWPVGPSVRVLPFWSCRSRPRGPSASVTGFLCLPFSTSSSVLSGFVCFITVCHSFTSLSGFPRPPGFLCHFLFSGCLPHHCSLLSVGSGHSFGSCFWLSGPSSLVFCSGCPLSSSSSGSGFLVCCCFRGCFRASYSGRARLPPPVLCQRTRCGCCGSATRPGGRLSSAGSSSGCRLFSSDLYPGFFSVCHLCRLFSLVV